MSERPPDGGDGVGRDWPYVTVRYDADADVWVSKLGEGGAAIYSQAETEERAIKALWSAAWLHIKIDHEKRALRARGPNERAPWLT